MLRWPIESIGFLARRSRSTRAPLPIASSRSSTATNSIADPENAKHITDPAGSSAFDGRCTSATRIARARVRDLLDGIDLVIEPGETMALVGLTGSGKTTLTALTTRLYDVTAVRSRSTASTCATCSP